MLFEDKFINASSLLLTLMIIPSYKKDNIVNLMSSILHSGGSKSLYPVLSSISPSRLRKYKNIVLVVIDGLGYDQVRSLPKDSFLKRHLAGKMSSVFPPTTAAAVTTFLTGAAPQNHCLVAWYMRMKEFGNKVALILPYIDKEKGKPLPPKGLALPPSLFESISRRSHIVFPRRFLKSHYNTLLCKKAEKRTYRAVKLNEFVNATARAVTSSFSSSPFSPSKSKYIYSYWPLYDELCHYYGKESNKARKHLAEIDTALQQLAQKIKGTNALLLITADHGHVSVTRKNTIILDDYPELTPLLAASMCGEPRAMMLYVKHGKEKEFEHFVQKKWRKYCTLHTPQELIKKKYFGLFAPHPSLKERIGDYIFLAKEGYVFREYKISKKHPFHRGHHGGLSKEELEVPLVMVQSNNSL